MKRKKLPRIFSVRQAKIPKHGIIAWADVESLSLPGERHTLTVERYRGKIYFHCSCPAKALFSPRADCIHVTALRKHKRVPR